MAGHGKKHEEEESGESAPLWMVTFSDMASLLMAFFVMLTTFASFGPEESEVIRGIKDIALKANYGMFQAPPKTSISALKAKSQTEQGSEKPTLEPDLDGGAIKDKELRDFRNRKVFLIESRSIFVANTSALSPQGKDFLTTLASFVKEVRNRIIIISESGADNNIEFGIARSMSALKFMVEQEISADYCNISAKGISPAENFRAQRMLEIVLLEEGLAK
ncbi:MAG: flagellar motor protein MotB [Phycisphaerales bacterium]